MLRWTACAVLALAGGGAYAADPASVSFQHNDWELACDNTRTCRAAGYQPDDQDENPVSVLLTRHAGPNQPVYGEVQFGTYGDNAPDVPATVALKINGRTAGTIKRDKNRNFVLAPAQVTALLAVLNKSCTIEFTAGETTWTLSTKGASAVLLKMDEFQGRLNTPGALARKGTQPEDKVLPPLAPPVIVAAAVPKSADKAALAALDRKAIAAELRQTIKLEDCDELASIGTAENPLDIAPLTNGKLVVSATCWRAAYNSGSAFAVINAKPPYAPVIVTTLANDYADGVIGASQKGRGLGDCWSSEDWTWDGTRFVHTHATWTGMCRLIAPGGAWDLPSLVTTVKPVAVEKGPAGRR